MTNFNVQTAENYKNQIEQLANIANQTGLNSSQITQARIILQNYYQYLLFQFPTIQKVQAFR